MILYTVRDVVCDYGIYENDELKIIVSSKSIALEIVNLLNKDYFQSLESNGQLLDLFF